MAGIFKLPIIYFIENNLYAVGTKASQASSINFLAQRALGLGMDGIVVDGMDPVSVYLLMKGLSEGRRRGEGPIFVEARTYRFYHHAGRISGSALRYRTREEEEEWLKKDPAVCYPELLKQIGALTEDEHRFIKEKVKEVIKKAVSQVVVEKEGNYFIPDEHWPSSDTILKGVPDGESEFEGVKFSQREDFKEFSRFTFINVMSRVMKRNMEKDPSVIVLGEEVANLGGGAYNATKFPLHQFPERVINTPISEAGFTGMAFGASMCGLKPIVEIMFPDFALVAADQLFNQIAKLRYLYGGEMKVPLVVRTRIATGLGYGAQHSSDLVGLFAMFRGWRIVAPSNPFDYVGLFNTAMLSSDPVLILEHHSLYKEKGEVPRNNTDYYIPFGKARVFRKGKDLTVVTYLRGVTLVENIAEELSGMGISVEGIDLRTLDYHTIDYNCIVKSVKKTGHLIILEESPKSLGIGARVADEVQVLAFRHLNKPISHIGSVDVPIPVSRKLEEVIVISEEVVKDEIERFFKW
jgi:2-oxoisovalerate dehydrogenase E1 component